MTTLDGALSPARYGTPRAAAITGLVLGIFAVWLAIPPWTLRSPIVPLVIALLGAACGAYGLVHGERRLGWWAVGVSLAAMAAVIWLQSVDQSSLNIIFTTGLIAATIRFAVPLGFAAIGGVINERSGVVNIGLEGMILAGAFFGIWAAAWSGSWIIGLLMAMVFGGLFALIHAFFCIHLRTDQIVSGFAINFLALGLTGYLFRSIYGTQGTPSDISRIPDVTLPQFLRDIPYFGEIFGQLNLMIWLMFILLIASWVMLFKTPIGLRLRSVGEHPRAADTVGINVYAIRYAAVIASGMLAALGGAYLSIGFTGSFNENMSAGRGYIALAAVILGKWNPLGAFAATLLFGFGYAIQIPLQREADISANLLSTLPYVLTLVALVGVIGRSVPPAAVGRPYIKQ